MDDKPHKRIRATQDESSVRHVQTKLSPKEYEKLEKFVRAHGVSMNLALRGIILDALEPGAQLPENIMTTKEKNLVSRFLGIQRSGNYVAVKTLTSVLDSLERMLLKD